MCIVEAIVVTPEGVIFYCAENTDVLTLNTAGRHVKQDLGF